MGISRVPASCSVAVARTSLSLRFAFDARGNVTKAELAVSKTAQNAKESFHKM